MIRRRSHRLNIAVLVTAMSLVVLTPTVAGSQDIPSVAVKPVGTNPSDPGAGEWFIFELSPGQTGRAVAGIFNPADVEQTVKIYIRDLRFNKNGSLEINDGEQTDVGGWGTVDTASITIPPKGRVEVGFSVIPGLGADPGDHIGVFVVESPPQGGNVRTIKRVANRIFVTIPGEAVRSFEITNRVWDYGGLWPRTATLSVDLRNTGRIRLRPKVSVNGEVAKGPNVLLSRTREKYFATVPVPWYGGPMRVSIEAVDDSGLIRIASASTFVIPWGLLLIVSLAGTSLWAGIRYWKKRRGRFEQLQSQIERLENILVASQLPDRRVEAPIEIDVQAGLPRAQVKTPAETLPSSEKMDSAKPKRSYKAKTPGKPAASKAPKKPSSNGKKSARRKVESR